MSTNPNTQAIHFLEALTRQSLQQGDILMSNIAWSMKVQLLIGRPHVKAALGQLTTGELAALCLSQRSQGSTVGAAWWTIRRCVEAKELPNKLQGRWTAARADRREGERLPHLSLLATAGSTVFGQGPAPYAWRRG